MNRARAAPAAGLSPSPPAAPAVAGRERQGRGRDLVGIEASTCLTTSLTTRSRFCPRVRAKSGLVSSSAAPPTQGRRSSNAWPRSWCCRSCFMPCRPPDYGQIALLTSIAGVASVVLSFGLEAAIVRMYFQLASRPEDQSTFLRTIGTFLVVVPIAVWLEGALFATAISGARFERVPDPGARYGDHPNAFNRRGVRPASTAGTAAGLHDPLVGIDDRLCRIDTHPGRRPGSRRTRLADRNARVVPAHAYGRHVDAAVSPHGPLRRAISSSPALVFSLPLLPHLLAHWGLSLSDRLILGISVSRDDIGVYNLGVPARNADRHARGCR